MKRKVGTYKGKAIVEGGGLSIEERNNLKSNEIVFPISDYPPVKTLPKDCMYMIFYYKNDPQVKTLSLNDEEEPTVKHAMDSDNWGYGDSINEFLETLQYPPSVTGCPIGVAWGNSYHGHLFMAGTIDENGELGFNLKLSDFRHIFVDILKIRTNDTVSQLKILIELGIMPNHPWFKANGYKNAMDDNISQEDYVNDPTHRTLYQPTGALFGYYGQYLPFIRVEKDADKKFLNDFSFGKNTGNKIYFRGGFSDGDSPNLPDYKCYSACLIQHPELLFPKFYIKIIDDLE